MIAAAFEPNRSSIRPPSHARRTGGRGCNRIGAWAATATALILGWVNAPVVHVTLTVDRPFLYALRDTSTGAVLFLGRVTDPTTG